MQLIPSIILSFILFSSASFAMNNGTSSTSSSMYKMKNEKKPDTSNEWAELVACQRLTSEALAKKKQHQETSTATLIPDQPLQNEEDIGDDSSSTGEQVPITWESLANTSFARSTSTTVNKSSKDMKAIKEKSNTLLQNSNDDKAAAEALSFVKGMQERSKAQLEEVKARVTQSLDEAYAANVKVLQDAQIEPAELEGLKLQHVKDVLEWEDLVQSTNNLTAKKTCVVTKK